MAFLLLWLWRRMGFWGAEARQALSQLASRLAVRTNTRISQMLSCLYGHLNLILVRSNPRAILAGPTFLPKSMLLVLNINVSLVDKTLHIHRKLSNIVQVIQISTAEHLDSRALALVLTVEL